MFRPHELTIAWRYLRARRAEGGISVMTWISLIGIALAVLGLIATLAVRSGFRAEFVDTIVGANPHVTVTQVGEVLPNGATTGTIADYAALADRLAAVPGVERAAPVVTGQVMASANGRNAGLQVIGIEMADLARVPRVAEPETRIGALEDTAQGIALGWQVARQLGLTVGDPVRIISPDGVRTAFGTSPRVKAYPVTYIFQVGRYDIDATRAYLPLAEAQEYFNRAGVVDEVQVSVADPEEVDAATAPLLQAAGEGSFVWTWKDQSGGYLRALEMEDNVMFVILSMLVMIATLNITSGLVMLVKNKGRDIGILRTVGLSQGAILRVFFVCGAAVGVAGTLIGVVLGVLFALYIDPIFGFVDRLAGGGTWDPQYRYLSSLPAKLEWGDVMSAVVLSLTLSFLVTIFPARRAARMNPVEALRYE